MRTVVPSPMPADPVIDTPTNLGAMVRAARTRAGITLADAAAACGISRQTMINIETGRGGVALPLVLQAAQEMGVTLLAVPSEERELARRAIVAMRAERGA